MAKWSGSTFPRLGRKIGNTTTLIQMLTYPVATDGLLTEMEALNVDGEEDGDESSDELQIWTCGT